MADVKVSALTALTGADLANGDQFLVTDVGSPNVSKSITADELAQGSQFSGRYKPLASDTIWIPAGAFGPGSGSPSLTLTASRWAAWLFDPSSVESISAHFVVPPQWITAHADLYWTNHAAGSGDVRLGMDYNGAAVDTTDLTTGILGVEMTIAAPSVSVLKVSRLVTSWVVESPKLQLMHIYRVATDAADTLANDAAIIGMRLTRAS
jgi:hypothetical protein